MSRFSRMSEVTFGGSMLSARRLILGAATLGEITLTLAAEPSTLGDVTVNLGAVTITLEALGTTTLTFGVSGTTTLTAPILAIGALLPGTTCCAPRLTVFSPLPPVGPKAVFVCSSETSILLRVLGVVGADLDASGSMKRERRSEVRTHDFLDML